MHEGHFWPRKTKIMGHEMGHWLGLWHTFHGVSEMETACSACWEAASGANGDITGDDCSDTPPTPVNYYCNPPGGTDPCSQVAWGETDYHNYMGYSDVGGGEACVTHFTPQQWGRMHCWTHAVLASWSSRCMIYMTGDANSNEEINATDVIYLVNYVFKSGPEPLPCPAAGDVDCNGSVTSADIYYLVEYVFHAGPEPCDVCPLVFDGTWDCQAGMGAALQVANSDLDPGQRDQVFFTEPADGGGTRRIELHVFNDEELAGMDIPLRFGQFGDPIDLVGVEFSARVAGWDLAHAEIDNKDKTVVLGLISDLNGKSDAADLSLAAEGKTCIATLVFAKDKGYEPAFSTFTTEKPAHELTFIYDQFEGGKPYVQEFTPELMADVSYKTSGQSAETYCLSESFPNPFNPSTSFLLTLPVESDYSARIYNVAGRLVKSFEGHLKAGEHTLTWDGRNDNGMQVASGVYFYRVEANGFSKTLKTILLK